jgi:AraC-like DNA-binding protein
MKADRQKQQKIAVDSPLVCGADGHPVLTCPADWKGPALGRFVLPTAAERGPQATGEPVVFVSCSGLGRRWYRSGIYTRELACTPFTLDTLSARYERDHARWESSGGESIGLRLPTTFLARTLHEEAVSFDLETRHDVVDETLTRHLLALADEVQAGFPNGRLYAEGLSISLVGWLAAHHAARLRAEPMARGLSPLQRQRVETYIEAHLSSSLDVEKLALQADLSPYHFIRQFKKAYGTPPHAYVLQRRVEHAARLLKATPAISIVDVANDCGFASQAHLTDVFRRRLGTTPARWRRGNR